MGKEKFVGYVITAKNYLSNLFGDLDNLSPCDIEIFDESNWKHGSTLGKYFSERNKIEVLHRNNEDDFLDTLIHEMAHQILDERIKNPPRWLTEGLAQYHSVFNRKVIYGNVKLDSLLQIKFAADAEKLISLEDLIIKEEGFKGCEKSLAYAESWSFVHFLMNTEIFNHLVGKYALTRSFIKKSEVQCLESKWICYLNELFRTIIRCGVN